MSIPDTPDLATEVADLLHQVNHTIRRRAIADAGPSGLTSSEMRAMRNLIRRNDPMRMSELADAPGIVRRSATSVNDGLEQLGCRPGTRVARRDRPHGTALIAAPRRRNLTRHSRPTRIVATIQIAHARGVHAPPTELPWPLTNVYVTLSCR